MNFLLIEGFILWDLVIRSNKKAACLLQDLMRRVEKISDSMAPVLIQGETGTGKSLLAEKIHKNSARKDKPSLPSIVPR